MKIRLNFGTLLIIVIAFLLQFGCTKNLFGTDKISAFDEIKGTVILNDGASPDSVFIWLQDLNLKSSTNKNGEFKIKLPSAKSQGARA